MRWLIALLSVVFIFCGIFWYISNYTKPQLLVNSMDVQLPWITIIVNNESIIVDTDGRFFDMERLDIQNKHNEVIVEGISSDLYTSEGLVLDAVKALHNMVDPIFLEFSDINWKIEVGDLRSLDNEIYFVDTVFLYDDLLPIKIGEGRYVSEKIKLLRQLLTYDESIIEKVNYIDLRIERRAYVQSK